MLLHVDPLCQLFIEFLRELLLLGCSQFGFHLLLLLIFIKRELKVIWELKDHVNFVSGQHLEDEEMGTRGSSQTDATS